MTTKSIGLALLQVFRSVGYVQKTGKITFGERYTYAGEADLIRAIRPAMAEAGIIGPIPIAIDRTDGEHAPTRKGGRQFCTDVTVTYRFLHAESGEHLDVQTTGRGIDSGDKGPYKAMTGALKYALRQTFLIETGDDPDATASGAQESSLQAPPAPNRTQGPTRSQERPQSRQGPTNGSLPPCPDCGGPVWDNREKRANGWRGPAVKCKDRDCDWTKWEYKPEPPPQAPPDDDIPF